MVFLGGTKMAILEKLKFYYVVLYKKSGFLPFFFVFFGHFLSLFWTPLNRCTFLDLLCHFFWNLFWNGLFYVFIYLGVNKGQKRLIKWSKSGQKVVLFDPFWTPYFWDMPCMGPRGWEKGDPKSGPKMVQKVVKKWIFGHFGTPFFLQLSHTHY